MIIIFPTSLIFQFTEDCRSDAYPPPVKDKVGTYVLNLDQAPEDRWTGLVKPLTDKVSFKERSLLSDF